MHRRSFLRALSLAPIAAPLAAKAAFDPPVRYGVLGSIDGATGGLILRGGVVLSSAINTTQLAIGGADFNNLVDRREWQEALAYCPPDLSAYEYLGSGG